MAYYHTQNNPPLDSIPSQLNPAYNLRPHFIKILCKIILISGSRSPKLCQPFRFPTKILRSYLISAMSVCAPPTSSFLNEFYYVAKIRHVCYRITALTRYAVFLYLVHFYVAVDLSPIVLFAHYN
jgi:hypothetical protein